MEKIDKYVNSLTNRLQIDRELQMDIKNELRSHLEDRVNENIASGMSEEKSVEEAIKQFGASEELRDQIWEANIRRMRVRSVAKWALRVTLGPAAIIFTIFHLLFLSSFFLSLPMLLGEGGRLSGIAESVMSVSKARHQKRLSDDERFILNADAESIAKRFPNNPIYCVNDITIFLSKNGAKIEDKNSEEFSELLLKLNRGETLEPENAFYNYLKAGILMEASSELEKNPDSKYEIINRRDGKKKEMHTYKLIISDRETFEKGMDEYFRGIAKPCFDSHTFDMTQEKLNILPSPSSLLEQIDHIGILAGTLLPQLSHYRDMARRVAAYAGLLFEEGDKSSALTILEDIEKPYLKLADESQCLIELLVARACISLSLGHAQNIYDKMNMPEEAGEVRTKEREDNLFFNSLWTEKYRVVSEEDIKKHAGILNSMLCPAIPGIRISFSPMRTVEQITAESAGLELLLAIFSILLITLGIITSLNMWKYRKKEGGPMLYFVGWRRLFKIILISMVLPMAIYLIFTRVLPFSGRDYGLNYEPYQYRFALEVLLGITSIFWLVLVVGFSAVRKRCLDAGVEVCRDGYFKPSTGWKIALLILFVIITAFFVGWERVALQTDHLGLLPISLVILLSIALFIRQSILFLKVRNGLSQFKLTAIRSLIPIIAFSVLFTGIASHSLLRAAERANIRLMNQPGNRYFFDEVEQSAFKYYKDYLREKVKSESSGTQYLIPGT